MARDGRHPPFPFPIPDPPRVQPQTTPFPPPPLPSPEETVRLLARRVAGLPLPLFFAIGAVVGIVLAVTVVSLVRRTSKRATQAKVVAVQASPVVEHAHALFIWPPAIVGERAPLPESPGSTVEAAPPPVASPQAPPVVAAMNRPRATPRTKAPAPEKRGQALPDNLLAAGL